MRRAWLLLALLLTGAAFAEPPVDVAPKAAAKKPAAKPAAKAKAPARPAWAELTAEQQKTLAPLKADWESLETERRRKWIGIAKRYPTMKAEEQERVQRRMQRWAALSPEQRRQRLLLLGGELGPRRARHGFGLRRRLGGRLFRRDLGRYVDRRLCRSRPGEDEGEQEPEAPHHSSAAPARFFSQFWNPRSR